MMLTSDPSPRPPKEAGSLPLEAWARRHPFLSKFLIISAGVALPLLILEFGSRLIHTFSLGGDPLVTGDVPEWRDTREFDSELFWRLKPNLDRPQLKTNRLGLRGPEIPRRKGREYRILSLGESTTFGYKIEARETYSAVAQRKIGSVDGRPLRIINAGVPGYSLFQGWTYLRRNGLDLEPDMVWLYFGRNDFLPVGYLSDRDALVGSAKEAPNDWELWKRRQAWPWKLSLWLGRRSNLVRGVFGLTHRQAPKRAVLKESDKVRVPEADRRKLLAMIRDACREHGIPLVIIVPWYPQFSEHESLLREFAAADGVPLIDLPRRLEGIPADEYFLDSMHPKAKGHLLIARVIRDEMARLVRK
jgi:lysophospholipase L1-like esterase